MFGENLQEFVYCAQQNASRCVVYGCSNYPDAKNQIALHPIPFYGDQRPEAAKRRKRWVDFVKQKRAKWEPSKQSRVCSRHFKADDFVRTLNLPGLEETIFPQLKRDEIGVMPYPTIQSLVEPQETISARLLGQFSARLVRLFKYDLCFI